MNLLIKLIINSIAIVVAAYILPGIHVDSVQTVILVAIVLGVVNMFVKPVIIFFTLPLTILSGYLQSVAASFAQVLYTPHLSLQEIPSSRVYYLLYLSLMYGAQIYLKERAITTSRAPYTIPQEGEKIEAIKLQTISHLEEKTPISEAAEIVIGLYLQQMSYVNLSHSLSLEGKVFNTEHFEKCHLTSLLYGYHFAKEILNEDLNV